jgi:hypothetical protein
VVAQRFDNEIETVVPEEHLITNEHGWRPEHPPHGRRLRLVIELCGDVVGACAVKEQRGVEARPIQNVDKY